MIFSFAIIFPYYHHFFSRCFSIFSVSFPLYIHSYLSIEHFFLIIFLFPRFFLSPPLLPPPSHTILPSFLFSFHIPVSNIQVSYVCLVFLLSYQIFIVIFSFTTSFFFLLFFLLSLLHLLKSFLPFFTFTFFFFSFFSFFV